MTKPKIKRMVGRTSGIPRYGKKYKKQTITKKVKKKLKRCIDNKR